MKKEKSPIQIYAENMTRDLLERLSSPESYTSTNVVQKLYATFIGPYGTEYTDVVEFRNDGKFYGLCTVEAGLGTKETLVEVKILKFHNILT